MEEQIGKAYLKLYKCKMKSKVKIMFTTDYLCLSKRGDSINSRANENLTLYKITHSIFLIYLYTYKSGCN